MNLNQIAERIAFALDKPHDATLKENIKFSVNYWRALLMRRDVEKNGMSDTWLQKFHINLVKVDKADACNFNLDCVTVLRSSVPIPKPVRLKNDSLFKFVGTVDGKPFAQVEYEEVPYTCYNKFTSKDFRFAYINDYIYVFNNTKLKYLALQYAVEEPNKINLSCTAGTCYSDDLEYPCPADIVQQIIAGILVGEFRIIPITDEVEVNKEQPGR